MPAKTKPGPSSKPHNSSEGSSISGYDRSRPPVARILVRGANWLGDTVMTLPALSLLRQSFDGAEISIITPPGNSRLLASTGYVDKIIEYHRKERGIIEFLALRKRLSGERFELSVLFQNAFEAALLVFLAGIPHRIGFATQHRRYLLTHPVSPRPPDQVRHQVFDYIDLVNVARSEMGSSTTGAERQTSFAPPMPVLRAGDAAGKAAIDLLHDSAPESEPRAGRPIVALNPGATNSDAKCWPEMRYAQLAEQLASEFDAHVILIGGQAERDLADRIKSGARAARITNLTGKTDIESLIGLLSRTDLLIGNDTGPAHVSAALGRPTLTIFGPTNEFETAPLGPATKIIRAENIECARCMFRTCPIDHRCMERVSVEEVIEFARPFLARFELKSKR